ncbi:murein biosynthesis integral membrane protein MurJ [Yimella lutea]|uniref:Murein biosynthesis integral membrane protein MurJ n=1 Tax=Yimella lutea TaxID=587872 RepID=A0A542ECG7_9MICO|nr:murein biosynthesis integral membrane protein MurJ [Yimella lutea]TQJ13005.1 murein biosynthesis integral membrane protein MurJ [Yimella lutea]
MSAEASRPSVLRSSAVMAAGTMVSRVLGLVRTILLAGVLGATTPVGNAFATANTLPNMIYILLAGGVLNAVLVPQMARALKHDDGGQGYTDKLLTLAMSILLVVTIVFTVSAPLAYFVMDFSGATPTTLGIAFAYICIPQIMFYGIYTLLGENLNARGRFGAFMWSPVLANVVAIAGLVWFWLGTHPDEVADPERWTWKMIAVLAGSATLGIVAQALVLIIPLRRAGYTFRPNFHFRGVGLRTASTIAIWAFAAVIVQQFGLIVSTNVLNAVPEGFGGTLAQQTAFLLFMLPHSIVTISLVTALYTRLSHAAAEGRTTAVKDDLDTGLRLSSLASIAVTVGSLVLVRPLTEAVWGPVDGAAIGTMTIAMMLGLVPFTVCVLVQRVFYAYEDAKTPFWMQLGCTAVAVVLTMFALLLPNAWMGPGVAFAQSVSYLVQAVMGWFLLQRRIGHIPITGAVRTYLRLTVAALVAASVAAIARFGIESVLGDGRTGNMVTVLVGGGLFLLVYMTLGRRFGVSEINQLLDPVLSRIPGRARPAATPAEPQSGTPEQNEQTEQMLDEAATGETVAAAAIPPERRYFAPDADSTQTVPVGGQDYSGSARPLDLRMPLPRVTARVDRPNSDDHTPSHTRNGSPENPRSAADAPTNLRMGQAAAGQTPTGAHETAATNRSTNEGEHVQGIESGQELAGRYLVRQAIASTDLKQVWTATDQTLSRDVTVTVFDANGEHAAAALDSARRAAAVEDRHLPRVLDVGTQDDISYVVSEALGGSESIASMLQFEPLPAEEARRMVGEAATGLHVAAGRGLHHLALTPHEIVRGRDGSVYVLGTATESALAGADDVPSADASRQDTVGLVQVLYAALTGKWPGEDEVRGVPSAARNSDGDVAPATSLRRNVPKDMNSLCLAVLGDDAGPRTPGELAAQLAPWSSEIVRDEPQEKSVAARPDNTDELSKAGAGTTGAAGAAGAVALGASAATGRTSSVAGGSDHNGIDDSSDDTAHFTPAPTDPDATHTFDATAMADRRREDDDYDPSFSELDPPLPMLNTGHDDPDHDTSKLALAIVAAFLVAALVLGIIGIRGLFTGGGDDADSASQRPGVTTSAPSGSGTSGAGSPSTPSTPRGQKLPVQSVTSFDPQGDGDERNELARNVLDGNVDTVWMSQVYGRADYQGGRKKGAGLLLDLGKPTRVGSVKIHTVNNPSTIQVFVTDRKDSVEGLQPFGEMTDKVGEYTVTGKTPVTGRYVILWVTKLAAGNLGGFRERIAEVEVLS